MKGRLTSTADVSQVFFDLDFLLLIQQKAQNLSHSRKSTTQHKNHPHPDTEIFNLTVFLNA